MGGYDVEKYARGPLVWHDLVDTNYWTLSQERVYLGDKVLNTTVNKVIIDSGTSFLLLPTEDFAMLTAEFAANFSCAMNPFYNLYGCFCDDDEFAAYPDINVQIDNSFYVLTKDNYIDRSNKMCYFKLMSLDFPPTFRFWVMGITFFHNYYTVFDSDNMRMGFAPSKLASPDIPDIQ